MHLYPQYPEDGPVPGKTTEERVKQWLDYLLLTRSRLDQAFEKSVFDYQADMNKPMDTIQAIASDASIASVRMNYSRYAAELGRLTCYARMLLGETEAEANAH